MCWKGPPFATAARRFFNCYMAFWFWLSDVDIVPFVSDNILKMFEVWKTVYAFFHGQVLARYLKLNNVWEFKSVEFDAHLRELMKSGVLCRREFELLWCGVMERSLYIIVLRHEAAFNGVISEVIEIYK